MITLPTYGGQYPKCGESSMYYGKQTRDGFILWGNIGKTTCCGSAHVVGIRLCSESIYNFLKDTRVSVLLLENTFYWDMSDISTIERELNTRLGEIGEVKIHPLQEEILVLFSVLSEDLYDEWNTNYD